MTRLNILIAGFFFAALFLSGTCVHAEQLLSRNATYRLIGEGYCYPEQVMPGSNDRAKEVCWQPSPLVETTDNGDFLIDGDTSDQSMVYTPWYWNRQWMEMRK